MINKIMEKIILKQQKIHSNKYRITYNITYTKKWFELEIRCRLLFFTWWSTIKVFDIKNEEDFEFCYNEVFELLNFINDPYNHKLV